MFVDVFCVAALMLCCSRLSVALHLSNGRSPARSPSLTEQTFPTTASKVSHPAPHYAPCFVDDIFAALRESVGNDDELTNSSVYQFGVCTASERSSVLLQLAKETRRNHRDGLEVLPPTGVILAEENERGALLLTFDLLQSPLLKPNPVLLLVFESPLTGGNLDVTFTSQSLHPNTQTSFLCELKRFLGDVPPQDPPDFPALQLDSLDSLPPLMLDLSSSDTLLAELINSSSQTIFSFPNWGSMFQVYLGELAMSPALLQEVKQRLQQTVTQVTEVIETEGEVGCSATKRLRRLTELSAFPEKEPAAGDVFKKTPKADVPKLCCQSHRPFR
ncbi:hypothetical protein NQZ68_014942 [Dissostichus eleginoides]|nr:hypothetical protein NQZ68_014942 [Dissostichus eleginoides]